jgi:putative Holliday junction resolvase
MKYLAIDFGKKRIGLALGSLIPYGAGFKDGEKIERAIEEIALLCRHDDVDGIVVGLPKRSQGEPGTLEKEIRHFAKEINHKTKLPVYFEEEQFTSAEAEAEFRERSKRRFKPGQVDELAAVFILERFLERKGDENLKPDIGVL